MTRWEELGMTAEEYVRSRWTDSIDGLWLYESKRSYHLKLCWHEIKGNVKDKDAVWLAAATFTAEHEKAIRQKREEIEECRAWAKSPYATSAQSVRRKSILAVLEGQLEGMLKGWKE